MIANFTSDFGFDNVIATWYLIKLELILCARRTKLLVSLTEGWNLYYIMMPWVVYGNIET